MAKRIEEYVLDATGLKDCLLRRYQEFGAKFILVRKQGFLGDEMGLGKTIQALAAITHLQSVNGDVRALAIVPASLRENWFRETRAKTTLNPFILQGWELGRTLQTWQAQGGLAVISYATLRGCLSEVLEGTERLDFVVADEAQYMKNPESQRSKATKELMHKATYTLAMTGTPVENHPNEFLSILGGLRHGSSAISQMQLSGDAGGPDYFRRVMKEVYLRRNKEDVLDELPELNEIEESISLDSRNLREHLQLMEAGTHFMHLRQHAIFGRGTESPKIDRVKELTEEYIENDRGVVIFSYFKRVLAVLNKAFPNAGVIEGGISVNERMARIDRFSEASNGGKVLLVQVVAGGVGLNMQAASAVIIVEPQLNPATEYQAIARVHRMGQRNSVSVHRLTCAGTIEDGIVERLKMKRQYMRDYAHDSLLKESSEAAISNEEISLIIKNQRERLREMIGTS